MAKQNIYDNDSFFENFKNLRNNKINFNDCIETPILLAMIPEVDGKRVLDIGCGMGQHAKQYSDMGAESVLGIDISEKMLEYAKEHFHAKNITYRQMALEDICQIDEQFDLITSSLAFDYAEDLDKIIYVFLTIFLYLLKCPQSLILSALRAFCFCGKPHISRSIFLYFLYQTWLKSW